MKLKKGSFFGDGLEKLGDEMTKINEFMEIIPAEALDDDALSLMLDETLKGKDIRLEYPAFYEALDHDFDLRQRFIDALLTIGIDLAAPAATQVVTEPALSPLADLLAKVQEPLMARLHLAVDTLQGIFFPLQPAYRGDVTADKPIYNLVNEEMELTPFVYSLQVDGEVSETDAKSLSLNCHLAVTPVAVTTDPAFPIEIRMKWGNFAWQALLVNEGRFHFADVPLAEFLAADMQHVTALMEFSISRPA
jgi:hypothetical protein